MGRSPKHSFHHLISACLYIARSGIRWGELPKDFPPKSTVHWWFKKWSKAGILRKALRRVIRIAEREGKVDVDLWFVDGMFIRSKGGRSQVGKTKCGKGHKLMVMTDRKGLPTSLRLTSASPHEAKLALPTLNVKLTSFTPRRIIGDKAYDSDLLDIEMLEQGPRMLAPHKVNRVNRTQDGRELKAYRERWIIEDFNLRIQRYRKILIKYERDLSIFEGFIQLATMEIAWKHLNR